MSNGNVIQMPGKEETPDLLDALDAFENGDDANVQIFFQTEAERAAFAEGVKFGQQDHDRARLVDLLELALIALDSDPVRSAQPGAFFRKGLRERMRARIDRERGRR